MELTTLTAVSPVDGRYGARTADLRPIFSEFGVIRHRVLVEVHWLTALASHTAIAEVCDLSEHARNIVDGIVENFSEEDAHRVKNIERTTKQHVKAQDIDIHHMATPPPCPAGDLWTPTCRHRLRGATPKPRSAVPLIHLRHLLREPLQYLPPP